MPPGGATIDYNQANWLAINNPKMEPAYAILTLTPLRVSLDILLPKGVDANVAAKGVKDAGERIRREIRKEFDEMLGTVLLAYERDKKNDKTAYKDAKKAVKDFNEYAKDLIDDLRDELVLGAAGALKMRGPYSEFGTIGDVTFREVKIRPAVFKSQGEEDEKEDEEEADTPGLMRRHAGKWLHLGLAWYIQTAPPVTRIVRIRVSHKKEFNKAALVKIAKLIPAAHRPSVEMAAGALKIDGSEMQVCFPKGKPKPPFTDYFKKKLAKAANKKLQVSMSVVNDLPGVEKPPPTENTKGKDKDKDKGKGKGKDGDKSKKSR